MEANKQLKLKIKLPTRVQPEVMPQPGEVGIYTNKIHYLRKYLLDELSSKKFAMDFMEPVDTTALKVPNYYTVIKRPMDVGTIIKRVQNRYYHRVDDLICDFRLVISNCFQFNRPGDVVYRNCLKLEKFFQRVLNKMPKGDEKPSTKDPRSTSKPHACEKNTALVQRQCQEHLRKLRETLAQEEDKYISKYFSAKIDHLSQKVDRCHFKTMEEFRFEVTSIFKNFDNQIITLHEVFHKACDEDPLQPYANCHWGQQHEVKSIEQKREPVKLEKRDVTDVLHALKRAENSVDHCVKSYSKQRENSARNLINIFDNSASKLKEKLMRGRTSHTSREYRELVLAEQAEQQSKKIDDETSLKAEDEADIYSAHGEIGGELLDLSRGSSQEPENIDCQSFDETIYGQNEATMGTLSSFSRSSHYPKSAPSCTVVSKDYETFGSYDTPMASIYPEIDQFAVDDADTADPTSAVSKRARNAVEDDDSAAYGTPGAADANSAESAFASAAAAYSLFTAVPGPTRSAESFCSAPATVTGANYKSDPATAVDSDSDSTLTTSADLDSAPATLTDLDYGSLLATGADSDGDCDPIPATPTAADIDPFPVPTVAAEEEIEYAFVSDTPADPESDPPPAAAAAAAAAAALDSYFAAEDNAPDPGPTPPATSICAATPSNTTTTTSTSTTLWSDLHLSSSDDSGDSDSSDDL